MANVEGRPSPVPPYPEVFPGDPFFALLSEEAMLRVTRGGAQQLVGRRLGSEGSIDIGIGTAKWGATATIHSMSVTPVGGGAPYVRFRGEIVGNVHAGVKIGCETFGVNYRLFTKPDPNGYIQLVVHEGRIVAVTRDIAPFVTLITPDGGVVEWILGILTTPLANAVSLALSPGLSQAFVNFAFDVMELPTVPIDIADVHLVVRPTDVQLTSWGGRAAVLGHARVTGS